MIRLKDVEMEYPNGTRAIRGISAAIEDGEFVFLVGPSGSGKSTIIKMLTGEEVPTAGRIMINGFSHFIKPNPIPFINIPVIQHLIPLPNDFYIPVLVLQPNHCHHRISLFPLLAAKLHIFSSS